MFFLKRIKYKNVKEQINTLEKEKTSTHIMLNQHNILNQQSYHYKFINSIQARKWQYRTEREISEDFKLTVQICEQKF